MSEANHMTKTVGF